MHEHDKVTSEPEVEHLIHRLAHEATFCEEKESLARDLVNLVQQEHMLCIQRALSEHGIVTISQGRDGWSWHSPMKPESMQGTVQGDLIEDLDQILYAFTCKPVARSREGEDQVLLRLRQVCAAQGIVILPGPQGKTTWYLPGVQPGERGQTEGNDFSTVLSDILAVLVKAYARQRQDGQQESRLDGIETGVRLLAASLSSLMLEVKSIAQMQEALLTERGIPLPPPSNKQEEEKHGAY